ncbi:class I SAM-dependent methyltransferase [Priestia abyssalis]|uniref:class I SAM-dependent methyltransferase n=1 Tax=Priestia abyssalis TaxID=1221450 RepID=UPI000995C89F|nr:methyltransferase domain-containing protein [Priestia abyssalis]
MSNFEWHEEARKQWDDRAGFWNKNSEEMWIEGSRKTIIPFLEPYIEKGSFIVDAGCGDGLGSYLLAKKGYRVTGVDLSNEMIEKAKARTDLDSLTFVQGDLTNLPLEEKSADAVMAINSLEWTEKPIDALNELKRIVKDKGHACVGILGPTAHPRVNSYRRLYAEKVIMNTMMPWEFEQLAMENGWTVRDGHGVYKRGVNEKLLGSLPKELQQSLTFMWVFMLQKK